MTRRRSSDTGSANEPPHDATAERALVGAMLITPSVVARLSGIVAPCDYYDPRLGAAAAAIVDLAARGSGIDYITVAAELRRRGRPDVDELALDLIAEETLHSHAAEEHARIVADHAERRRLIAVARQVAEAAADGADSDALRELLVGAHDRTRQRRRHATQVVSVSEVEDLPPLAWLVAGLLPAGAIAMLVSPPNLGKTTGAVGIARAVTHGVPWCGLETAAGSVIYVTGEGRRGIGVRSRAWSRHAGVLPAARPFEVVDGLPALSSPAGLAELRRIVADHAARHGAPPALVIVDTLAVHWAESEDRAEHVGPCLAALRAIAVHGTTVLLLHHPRKPNGDRGAAAPGDAWATVRGSGAWVGGVDVLLAIEAGPNECLRLSTPKMRDAARAGGVLLRLQIVALDDGGTEHGPVVVPAAPTPAPTAADAAAEDADHVARVVAALRRLGTAKRVDTIVREARLRLADGRAAVDRATTSGTIIRSGSRRHPTYSVATEGGGGALPHTPVSTSGTPTAAAGLSSDVPTGAGRPGRHGTPDVDPVDNAMPEQPGRRQAETTTP